MDQQRYSDLEMDADVRQQRREWVMERFAWAVLTLLLIGVAFGLFGRGGPLSERALVSGDGRFRMEYDRFVRYHSPDQLQITLTASAHFVRVRLDSGYLRHIQVERITPRPDRETSEDGAVVYRFEVSPQTAMRATFYFTPETLGRLDGWVAIDDGVRYPFSQFVYP